MHVWQTALLLGWLCICAADSLVHADQEHRHIEEQQRPQQPQWEREPDSKAHAARSQLRNVPDAAAVAVAAAEPALFGRGIPDSARHAGEQPKKEAPNGFIATPYLDVDTEYDDYDDDVDFSRTDGNSREQQQPAAATLTAAPDGKTQPADGKKQPADGAASKWHVQMQGSFW